MIYPEKEFEDTKKPSHNLFCLQCHFMFKSDAHFPPLACSWEMQFTKNAVENFKQNK